MSLMLFITGGTVTDGVTVDDGSDGNDTVGHECRGGEPHWYGGLPMMEVVVIPSLADKAVQETNLVG